MFLLLGTGKDEEAIRAPAVSSICQWRGFKVFTDAGKGNCAACHSAPNFTDNGFHNIGLPKHGDGEADPGRFAFQ